MAEIALEKLENKFDVPSYLVYDDHVDTETAININYGPRLNEKISRVDLVSSLLFDQRKDVVIFGEGNFTFAIALAAARNTYFIERLKVAMANVGCNVPSCDEFIDECLKAATSNFWEGITLTYLESEEDSDDEFDKVKNINQDEIKNLQAKFLDFKKFFDLNSKIISAVPSPASHTIRYGVDATTTADPSLTTKDVVWFQCPWTNPRDDIPELITDFMTNLSKQQKSGQYLLIGIANQFPYVQSYMLKHLGIFDKDSNICGYRFIGGDTAAVRKLLFLGYRHEGWEDIHEIIFDDHVTLIFEHFDS